MRMRTRDLMLACGTTAAILAAGPAFAQQSQPDKPTKGIYGQPSNTTPRTQSGEPSILKDLEGVWKVSVSVNPKLWHNQLGVHGADTQWTSKNNTPGEPGKVEPNKSEPNKNEPGKNQPNLNQPNHDRTPEESASMGMRESFSGYAQTQLVLGDKFLEQRIVIPDMPGSMDAASHWDANKRTTTPGSPAGNTMGEARDDSFRGICYFAFDSGSKTYSLAMMDSREGRIHTDTGTYDATSRKLVFNGSGMRMHGMRGPETIRTPSTTAPGRDTTTPKEPINPQPGVSNAWTSEDVKVVVELMGADQFKVTMYKAGAAPTYTHRDSTPSTPSTNRDLTPGANEEGEIIYQATYTKATGTDADQFRRKFMDEGSKSATHSPSTPGTNNKDYK